MRDLAARHGVGYIRRERAHRREGGQHQPRADDDRRARSSRSSTPTTWPTRASSRPRSGYMDDPEGRVRPDAAVLRQHASGNRIAAASWAQQALFFGAIARGKDGLDAVFCCGTNVLFRREAFESVGGFPTNSLTEDFELSIHLHERGWSSAYVPDVLARGLGPEDMAAYVSQQQRWARGCLSGLPRALRAKLPLRLKAQYLLSALVLPVRLDGAHLHELPGGPAARRRPADRRHHRARVPAPLRALLRGRADDGGARRRGLLHVRRLRAGGRELLDPHPVHDLHGAAQVRARSS